MPLITRPISDDDAEALIELIGSAYAEHPGCVLDLPGVDGDLLAPAATAAATGGRWWVVVDPDAPGRCEPSKDASRVDGEVVASIGAGPRLADGTVELERLYVAPSHRRRGLASALVSRVEAHAAGLAATGIELWSDTRFSDAHRLYARLGYRPDVRTRELHDPSATTERRFVRALTPPAPRRTVVWDGPHGRDTCQLRDLPDGTLLAGVVGEMRYLVEVDGAWRPRCVEITDEYGTRRLTSDGLGRWWRQGAPIAELAGCLGVAIETTPATIALPLRRRAADPAETATHGTGDSDGTIADEAVWLRVPGPRIERLARRYERRGVERWSYTSPRAGAADLELEVDPDGLLRRDDHRWSRR